MRKADTQEADQAVELHHDQEWDRLIAQMRRAGESVKISRPATHELLIRLARALELIELERRSIRDGYPHARN